MSYADLDNDLKARWRPSDEQVAEADAALAAAGDGASVHTAHILVGKHFGFWTEGIEVIALPGVYADRNEASVAAVAAAKAVHEVTGKPVTGGYTWHMRLGEWAVFEDILADYSDDTRIARRNARKETAK